MSIIRKCVYGIAAGVLLAACAQQAAVTRGADTPVTGKGAEDVLKEMEAMADAQIGLYQGKYPADWVQGTFYVGLAKLTHVSKDPKYLLAERDVARQLDWDVKTAARGASASPFHADNQCVVQMYIDLALSDKTPDKLNLVKKNYDDWLTFAKGPAPAGGWPGGGKILWWWCDALFMAPTGLERYSAVSGDDKYIKEMDKQFWLTADLLYDKDEHLFARDASYLPKREANGKKVFWARGNGWVAGGLADILTYMPKDFAARPKYEKMFKEIAEKLGTLQQADGMWRASLLDAEEFPEPETSGTGFYCYALAWGINNGYLERAKYEPMVDKAWDALNAHKRADGVIGYVQGVGAAPAATKAETTQPYAVGAYLLAGAEILQLRGK